MKTRSLSLTPAHRDVQDAPAAARKLSRAGIAMSGKFLALIGCCLLPAGIVFAQPADVKRPAMPAGLAKPVTAPTKASATPARPTMPPGPVIPAKPAMPGKPAAIPAAPVATPAAPARPPVN